MKRIALLCGLLALVVACQDHGQLTAPEAGYRAALLDGSTGGNSAFYFLPPLVPDPEVSGEFDAGYSPEVVVCEWDGSACVATVAEFGVDGSGPERVRIDATDEHYMVNWDTGRVPMQAGAVYRIAAYADGAALGHVDVVAVRTAKMAKEVPGGLIPLVMGRTLPIRFRIEAGLFPTATVVGRVTTIAGAGLGDVRVVLEGTAIEGTTNSAGGVTLSGIRPGRTAVLRLSLAGYVDQLVQVEMPHGVETATFRTSMIEKSPPVVVSATTGGVAESTDGAAVVLPPSGLVDGDGAPVSGDVNVSITPVDVSGDGIDAFPGSFTGINSDGEAGLLMTYGVAEYTFEQEGEELQLAPGQTATVIIPIYTGEAGLSLGDNIPLWYLDEATGEWIQESLGTVVALSSSPTGLGLEADVSHFSWWNIDVWVQAPYEPLVRCEVDGAPVDCTVHASVTDPSFPRTNAEDFVPAAGARLTFPPSPTVTQVSGEAGNRYGTYPGGVSGPSGGGASDVIVVDLTESGVISADHSVVTLSTTAVELPGTIEFRLEGRDETGAPMTAGGAQVRFYRWDSAGGFLLMMAQDNGDGTYSFTFRPTTTGDFRVQAIVNGLPVTTGEPTYSVAYSPTAARGATSTLSLSPTSVPIGGQTQITLHGHDVAGDPKSTGGDIVRFSVLSGALTSNASVGPVTDHGDGTYSATLTSTAWGTPVEIAAEVNHEPVTTGNPTLSVTEALLSEAGADAALTDAFNFWWHASRNYFTLAFTTATMSDGPSSSWGNAGMLHMSSEPRQAWDNDPAAPYAFHNLRPWLYAYVAVSRSYDVLRSLDAGLQMNGGADDIMTRAAAKLAQGLSHGHLALMYDQAFVLSESVDLSTGSIALQPYTTVMDSALAYLQEAITLAEASSFTLPPHWINGAPLTAAELAQVAHSYRARFQAAVARTPAERQAADWNAIMADIAGGITTVFGPVSDGQAWYDDFKWYVHNAGWFRADYRMIGGVAPNDGETDPNGAFAAWLAQAPADRMPFASRTTDRRIWDGTYDASGNPNPGTYLSFDPGIPFRAERGTYHFSHYVFSRFSPDYGRASGHVLEAISPTELALLEAEARIRLGLAGAADLINVTRTGNGGLSAATDSDPDLFDKMAYEKRLETYHLEGALGYYDRRGWGTDLGPTDFGQGLVDGTPYHFPVPGAELQRLGIANYTFGGSLAPMAFGAGGGGGDARVPAARVHMTDAPPIERVGLLGPDETPVPSTGGDQVWR